MSDLGTRAPSKKEMEAEKTRIQKEYTEQIVLVKTLRQDMDKILQRIKNSQPSREKSLSITKMQEAIMWLGMELKRLGAENPYPSSKDPSTGDKVEPTADGMKM